MTRKTVRVYEDDYIDLKKIIKKLQYDICTDAIETGLRVLSSKNPRTQNDTELINGAKTLVNDALALLPKP